ncbi:MAG TPA: gluconeogenesis factor YvcK family protein [Thermomicrobiaceae bacterium]|nr:gluconeogenesis factor YvcK family protein [Thermomicrobiaceae bacterium]
MKLRTWLRPGMFIKRWVVMLFAGLVLTSLALAMGLAWLYRNYHFPSQLTGIVRTVTLQFIPHPYREIGLLILGAAWVFFAFYELSRSLLAPFLAQRADGQGLVEIIQRHRFGPVAPELRVVAVGGGTGLSTLLRGLKLHNIDITAIVTVGDDGGSSGRLRTEFNIPPPGDIRNCLVALADNESVMSELFQYRFEEGSSLDGHSFGNLFITALTRVSGSFEQAVVESSRVLAVRGKVLPSTLEDIVVCGEMADGRVIRGESNITNERGTIKRIFLDPCEPQAYDPAIIALLSADVIVLGPGSLYTSVLPNLLVPGIAHAIRSSPATKVYVCNVATQRGETDNFGAIDHVRALQQHVNGRIIDYALVNSNIDPVIARIKPEWSVNAVGLDGLDGLQGVRVLLRDVISAEKPLRHDPAKLASELLELARQARLARDGSGVIPDTGAPEEFRPPVTAALPLTRQTQSKESLR